MKKISLLAQAGVVGILAAAVVAAPVFACKPVGGINKTVQDITTNSANQAADNASTALGVNSGDTLVYTITVKNSGAAAGNSQNDMTNVVLTDTLPIGVQLVGNPNQLAISEKLGTIKPGDSVTKSYKVKVTAVTNGTTISNTACFTGDSKDNQNNQHGCDTAVVKVSVSTPTPAAPAQTQTPAPTPTSNTPAPGSTPTPPATAAALPNTGNTALATSLVAFAAVAGGYILSLLRFSAATSTAANRTPSRDA